MRYRSVAVEYDGQRLVWWESPSPLMNHIERVVVDECVGQESSLVGQLRKLQANVITGRFGMWGGDMAKLSEPYSKNLPNNIARTDVKGVIESLAEKKATKNSRERGVLCARIRQIRCRQEARQKGAERHQSVHKGPTIFEAKPARKIIRARPVKAAKDAIS